MKLVLICLEDADLSADTRQLSGCETVKSQSCASLLQPACFRGHNFPFTGESFHFISHFFKWARHHLQCKLWEAAETKKQQSLCAPSNSSSSETRTLFPCRQDGGFNGPEASEQAVSDQRMMAVSIFYLQSLYISQTVRVSENIKVKVLKIKIT